VHPIERLRYVARAGDVPTAPLVREAAIALASFAHDPVELLTACRQLIERRPTSGPLLWVTARMLTGTDPGTEAWDAVEALERDTTARELAHALPADSTVLVIGASEICGDAVLQRPDVEVLVADTVGEGYGLIGQLDARDHVAVDVPAAGVGAAAADVDLVLLEAEVMHAEAALARSGSLAAAAVAAQQGTPVWLAAGVGRVVPTRMYEYVADRSADVDPWDDEVEAVPLALVDKLVGPSGLMAVAEVRFRVDCPIAPELFR
jgi:translation initiation factor 2B subunit (eIF-2B alpha/beta/delta family)